MNMKITIEFSESGKATTLSYGWKGTYRSSDFMVFKGYSLSPRGFFKYLKDHQGARSR